MRTLAELTAADSQMTIGGKVYTITPLSMRDYGKITQRITSERGDAVKVARELCEGLPPEDRKAILDRAFTEATRAKHVTAEELEAWRWSIPGFCFCFWLMLLPKHPELTEDDTVRLIEQLGEESMAEIMAAGDGLPEGNPASPARKKRRKNKTA